MTEPDAAAKAPRMKFSHLGLVVADLEMMQDFYTRVLGFELTDKGKTGQGVTMAFMTLDPAEHHQVFLVEGKPGELPSNTLIPGSSPVLHHLSFRLASLADLRTMYARLRSETERDVRAVTHGICWAIYATDPEGNSLEFFADTPWYVHQPFYKPVDLAMPEDELYRMTEEWCRASPGFRPYAAFNEALAERVPASLVD